MSRVIGDRDGAIVSSHSLVWRADRDTTAKKEPVCRREKPAALRVVVVLGRYRADRILITVAGAALDSHVAHQTSLLTHPSLGWWAPNAANDKRPPS